MESNLYWNTLWENNIIYFKIFKIKNLITACKDDIDTIKKLNGLNKTVLIEKKMPFFLNEKI